MDVTQAFIALGIALGLGMLVGIQRERADPSIAGVRTFPLITILGVLCGILSDSLGGWAFAAGMLAVATATAMGNWLRPRTEDSPGITTEIAILVMFAVGGLLWTAPVQVGVATGVACAVLLHMKGTLHRFAGEITDADQQAIMRFAAITFVVLPVLPDRTFGPFNVWNPRQIWWMVVLVVGMSLAGYILQKLLKRVPGALIGGVLGGVISSTAATASFSRQVRDRGDQAPALALAAAIASSVVFIRLAVEITVVARSQIVTLLPPLGIMFAGSLAGVGIAALRARGRASVEASPGNPSEMKSALKFAVIYAVVLLLVAAGKHWLGESGVYAVALVSGLTDMDAITLSTSRMAASGGIEPEAGAKAIVLATTSNLVFKVGLAASLGGWAFARRLIAPAGAAIVAGALALMVR